MARVYLFNPLVAVRYGPGQTIVVNSDGASPYIIKNTSSQIAYVPFSTSGARVPGSAPSANSFVDSNTLLISNDAQWTYAFDISGQPGDLIAYLFRAQIILLASSGNFIGSYQGRPAGREHAGHPHRLRAPREDSPPGSVFVFNLFSEKVTFLSNGARVDDIPAWSNGAEASIYTPFNIPVQRVVNSSEGAGKIFNGVNRITVVAEAIGEFSLPLSGSSYPIIQNLLLYLMRDCWYLFDECGAVFESGPIHFSTQAGHAPPHSHPHSVN